MTSEQSPDQTPELESANQLLEQAKFVLDDGVRYAGTLKATRNTLGAVLFAVIGLGLFRIHFGEPPESVSAFPKWAVWTLKIGFTFVAGCLIIGSYYLYTDKPWKIRKKKGQNEPPSTSSRSDHQRDPQSGSAIATLDLNDDIRMKLELADPADVARVRARMYSLAYEKITHANRRVRNRIEVGKFCILLGFWVFILLAIAYAWLLSIDSNDKEVGDVASTTQYTASERRCTAGHSGTDPIIGPPQE